MTATYPDLHGKVVLLTGIGQVGDQTMWGNGAASAKTLAHNGCKIYGCDLNLKAAEHTKKRVQTEHPDTEIEVVSADVTKSDAVKKLVAGCMERFGRIDILVNNVGNSQPGGPATISEETWDKQMDVNLKSVYLCCHEVLPIMESQGSGAITCLASISATRWIGKAQIGYSTTKAALIQFTKITGVMYASKGIRMNIVIPGLIHTPLVSVLADKYNNGDYAGLVKKRDATVPMGKMGTGFDVANAVTFLVSESAKYITGTSLLVDGGITGQCTPDG